MQNSILEALKKAVVEGDIEKTVELSNEALKANIEPIEAIKNGLGKGVKEVGDKFGRGEAFLVDLVMAGEAMKGGMSVFLPKIQEMKGERRTLGKVLMGTVKGDVHSIGKDIVCTLLEAEGFDVINIGEDVPNEKFIEKVNEHHPDILGLSSLLTSTVEMQREVIEDLKKAGLREKVIVMIGGAPTNKEWADEIGANGWEEDAVAAVSLAKALVSQKSS